MTVDPLALVRLGRTNLQVTRLGLGTAPLATVFWGNEEPRAVATAARAAAVGIRLFDTAPLYGLGESERRLGRGLASVDRSAVVVATKAGRLLVPGNDGAVNPVFDFSADATKRSIESSLERLGLARVDIVHIHDPEDHLADAVEGTFPSLAALRDNGIIGAVSLGTNVVETARFFLRHADLDCMMVAGRLTLLDQSAGAELIPSCREAGVGYLAAGVFNSGVLADPAPGAWYDYAPAPGELLTRVETIRSVCDAHGVSVRDAALHYPLSVEGVTAEVVGMAAPDEVDDNVASLRAPIPPSLWRDLGLR